MLRTCILLGVVFAFTVLMFCSVASAAYLDLYTEEDGLADNDVELICIDDSGVKWFAAHYGAGVSRFDEHSWATYPANAIMDMALDDQRQPWLAAVQGLRYLDLQLGEFHTVDYPGFSACSAVIFGPYGALWTGGWAGDLLVWRTYDLSHWKYWKCIGPLKFAIDAEGRAWFVGLGPDDGVYRISEDGQGWDRIDDNLRLPSRGIRYRDIHASQAGQVWVQSYAEDDTRLRPLYSDDYEMWHTFDKTPFEPSTENDLWLECIAADGLWFRYTDLSYMNNAFYYDYSEWRSIEIGSYLRTIEIDELTGDVWFGTNGGAYVLRGGPDAWPPVWIEMQPVHDHGTPESVGLTVGNAEFQMDLRLDFYVAVQLQDGTLLYAPDWTPSMTPFASGVDVPIGLTLEDYPLLELDLTGITAGTYRFYSAFTHAGTMNFASNIASCEWQVE